MSATTWGKLRPGDWIVCPSDDRAERVTMSHPYPGGRQVVRTTSHDHIRDRAAAVKLADDPRKQTAEKPTPDPIEAALAEWDRLCDHPLLSPDVPVETSVEFLDTLIRRAEVLRYSLDH